MIRVLRAAMTVVGIVAFLLADALAEHDEEPAAVLARTDPAFAKRMNRLGGLFAEEPSR